MRRKRLDAMTCSIAKALDEVGDPWTMLVVRDVLLGVTRFDDLQRRLDIPRATLADRLERLTACGIVERRDYRDRPPRVEYRPTDKGRALRPVVITLMQWGDRWARDDEPPTRLVDERTGDDVRPMLVDAHSGQPLHEMRVRAVGEVSAGIERSGDVDL